MKRYLAVGGAVILAIILIIFFYPRSSTAPSPEAIPKEVSPTVVVATGQVTVIKDGVERAVVQNETIETPFELRTGSDGKVILQTPDNSELRLDVDSEISVTSFTFNEETRSLVVSAKLAIGRVWSSITALATPESAWEVETSNVVATVRGTAFGVEARTNGDTRVVGSENSVELTLINPETGTRTERKLPLNADEFIIISNEVAKDETAVPAPTRRDPAMPGDPEPWVMENHLRDDELRGTPPPMPIPISEPDTTETETVTPTPLAPPATQPTTVTSPTNTPKAVSLAVIPSATLTALSEGATVSFTAVLTYSDQTKRNVAQEVEWGVIGKIGTISRGVFTAKLDSSVLEFGKSSGSVTAIWTEPSTGEKFLGTSEIFEVKATVNRLLPQG